MGTKKTRDRILAGAADAFGTWGLTTTTVQQILEASKVSRRTFYQYYSSAEDVMSAVYDQHMDALLVHLAEGIQGAEGGQKVTQGLERWLSFQLEAGDLLIALQAEAARPASMLHARRERVLDTMVSTIVVSVKQALGVGLDPLVFRTVVLGLEGLVLYLHEQGQLADSRERLGHLASGMFFSVLSQSSRWSVED